MDTNNRVRSVALCRFQRFSSYFVLGVAWVVRERRFQTRILTRRGAVCTERRDAIDLGVSLRVRPIEGAQELGGGRSQEECQRGVKRRLKSVGRSSVSPVAACRQRRTWPAGVGCPPPCVPPPRLAAPHCLARRARASERHHKHLAFFEIVYIFSSPFIFYHHSTHHERTLPSDPFRPDRKSRHGVRGNSGAPTHRPRT